MSNGCSFLSHVAGHPPPLGLTSGHRAPCWAVKAHEPPTWTEGCAIGDRIEGRYGHTAVMDGDGKMWVFGGDSGDDNGQQPQVEEVCF